MTIEQIKYLEQEHNVTILFICKSGSHLYGTNDIHSDKDYKGVFIPKINDILLKKDKEFITLNTNHTLQKNTSDDIDIHLYSIYTWLKLLAKGETNALDTLFAIPTTHAMVYSSADLRALLFAEENNYLKLITSSPNGFIGYCIQQARRYTVKGERYTELTKLIDHLEAYNIPKTTQIRSIHHWLSLSISDMKYVCFVEALGPRGSDGLWTYLEVLGRKYADNTTIEYVLDNLYRIRDGYGHRVVNNTVTNWKALSHAVRVVLEINELLTTTKIVFPLIDKEFVYNVKKGNIPLDQVIQFLEKAIVEVDELLPKTTLNSAIDSEYQQNLILGLLNKYGV